MLATPHHLPFQRDGWIFEVKWDGYRSIVEICDESVRVLSRNGNDLSGRFPSIVKPLARLTQTAVLDGELVVLDAQGIAQFGWLQDYPRYGGQLALYLFDILYLAGHDLTRLPLLRRKQLLRQIVPESSRHLRYCEHVETEGELFFRAVCERGIEGIVAKDGSSPYVPGRRSSRWLKIKAYRVQRALIAGYKEGAGGRLPLGSLVLAREQNDTLVHIGEVGTGLPHRSLMALWNRIKPLERTSCPFGKKPKIAGRVHWLEPVLWCQVRFQAWTVDQRLRHPVWIGLEEDLSARADHGR